MSKIQPVKVVIERAEGPSHLCGETTVETIEQANAVLRRNAETAPTGGAYDKHDFKIFFADGEVYEGRIDLHHPSYRANETLGQHVRWFLRFYGGLLTDSELPRHIKPEQYRKNVGEPKADYQAYLDKYDFGE